MFWLILVSLLWAFSFGLIKTHLAGVDPTAAATLRLGLALLVFLPLLRPRRVAGRQGGVLLGIGAVQFGVMYALYMMSFQFLQAHEVALFTIFTPLYVTLINGAWEKRFEPRWLLAAALAVAGSGLVLWNGASSPALWRGFVLVQFSNACFALGQVAYKRLRPTLGELRDDQIFGWMLLGGFGATGLYSLHATDWSTLQATPLQWAVLFYLGTIASGLGFFLWNRGVMRVNAGTLAVFNNLKIPLAVLCSLLFFAAAPDNVPRLLGSFLLMGGAVWLTETTGKKKRR